MGRRGLRRHERQLQMGHNPIDRLIIRYSGRSSAHPKSQAFDIPKLPIERESEFRVMNRFSGIGIVSLEFWVSPEVGVIA
jgi:hypothetical protein